MLAQDPLRGCWTLCLFLVEPHQEPPSVCRHVVTSSPGGPQITAFEQLFGRPRPERRGRPDTDGHEGGRPAAKPIALHIEQLPTTRAPRRLISPVSGNQVTLSWAGIWLHVDLMSSGLIGHVRQPPPI